jgi:hypothetical protein
MSVSLEEIYKCFAFFWEGPPEEESAADGQPFI